MTNKFYGQQHSRRHRSSPNENTSSVRGLHSNQWDALYSSLRYKRSVVCRTEEEIPMLDFLDLIYKPEAKAHWLANAHYFGSRWVTAARNDIANHISASVCARKEADYKGLSIELGGVWWKPFLPVIGGHLSCNLLFAPLDMLDGLGVPERIRPLHAKYGRHIVRCAREDEVFRMAMKSLAILFAQSRCTRMIRYFFPEIIEHVPYARGQYNYWEKTRDDSFASKYKEDKGVLDAMEKALGPNWETYKKFILGMIARAVLVEAANREKPDREYGDKWKEREWYETTDCGGKPIEDWRVRLTFAP